VTTLGDIAGNVADQLARSDLDAQIKREIALVIKRYQREVTWLHEVHDAELTTAAGVIWYDSLSLAGSHGYADYTSGDTALSTERLLAVRYMRTLDGTLEDQLYYLPIQTFLYWHENSVQGGEITHYTLYGGQLGIWPTPNNAQTIKVTGIFQPTVPSADSDASVWFDEAQELVEAATAARVARKYLQDYERARDFEQIEAVQISALRSEGTRRMASGRIRPRC